jgi:prolyl oligopeptidase
LAYPAARHVDARETRFGVELSDPFRWLENDVHSDPQVMAWVDAQNSIANGFLEGLSGRDALKTRLAQLYDYERVSVPEKKGERYFYTRNDGLQDQPLLLMRESAAADPTVLADPNSWSSDGAVALAEWKPNEQGTLVLYAVQEGGSDWRTLKVLDVETGTSLQDTIGWVKFSFLTWSPSGDAFYYSRFPEPAQASALRSRNTDHSIYRHRIGSPQSSDQLIFATPARPELSHVAQISEDGRWLVILSWSGTPGERYEVRVLDTESPESEARVLVAGLEHNWGYVGSRGSILYFLTDAGAPRQRLVSIDAAENEPIERTIVAESECKLQSATLVGDKLIGAYLIDANTEVRVFDLGGSMAARLALPCIGTAIGFPGKTGDPETFFAFTSFNRPTTICRYDVSTGETSCWAAPELPFTPDDFVVEQHFCTSRDGARIPMFVVRHKNTTGPAPTLLYGYGGFNLPLLPTFSPARIAWLEHGGIYAVANLRGGGEYGKEWHEAGRLGNKQNVVDDFIAVGGYLKEAEIAAPSGLAIEGGSHGGMVIGAVLNQRPDLFDAAHASVGVFDLIRYEEFTAGRYWIHEFGSPKNEDDFRNLLGYSPYHNIRTGLPYPPLIVTTADMDDRVVPGHSFKYIAALQEADPSGCPHLIRIESRAGHAFGKPTSKIVAEAADVYAFLGHFVGIDFGSTGIPS